MRRVLCLHRKRRAHRREHTICTYKFTLQYNTCKKIMMIIDDYDEWKAKATEKESPSKRPRALLFFSVCLPAHRAEPARVHMYTVYMYVCMYVLLAGGGYSFSRPPVDFVSFSCSPAHFAPPPQACPPAHFTPPPRARLQADTPPTHTVHVTSLLRYPPFHYRSSSHHMTSPYYLTQKNLGHM